MNEVAPAAIDGTFVPATGGDVAAVYVGVEIALGRPDPDAGFMHTCALNECASIVWQCFDGESTIDQIADDIADIFEVDAVAVRADVVGLTRDLSSAGFLVGVSVPEVHVGAPLAQLAIGDEFPEIVGRTSDGRAWSSSRLRGAPDLVVSWRMTCGWCASIANGLDALTPRVTNDGYDVVLVASSTSSAEVEAFARHDLAPHLVLRDDQPDPLLRVGTPAAYLLDASGRVREAPSIGAADVMSLVSRLIG